MANLDAPMGATNARHITSGTPARQNVYAIASAYDTNIFTGDFVKLVAGGGIEAAAAGDRLLGVFNGVYYTDSQGNQVYSRYWPADTVATNIEAYVIDDPDAEFVIQSAGSTVAADVGNLGDHVAGTGSTLTGQSAHEINGTTGTGTAGLRILGKVDSPDNEWGTNVNLRVQIWEHEYSYSALSSTPGV